MIGKLRTNKQLSRLTIIAMSIIVTIFPIISMLKLSLCNAYIPVSSTADLTAIKPFQRSELSSVHGNNKCFGEACSIYILNLPSRPDRREESIALMRALDLQAFLIPAYSVHSPEIRSLIKTQQNLFFKLSEVACWASHMRVWITIAHTTPSEYDNSTWSIIFEDDIDLETYAPTIMQSLPSSIWHNADLIYLGHCDNPPGTLIHRSLKHIHRVHEAIHPSCTHAYAIKSSVAKKLINLLSNPTRAVDDSIVQLVDKKQLIVYSIHPPLAIQKLVSETNPSDVNQINRRSLLYRIRFAIYTFLQWWRGVENYSQLQKPASNFANATRYIKS